MDSPAPLARLADVALDRSLLGWTRLGPLARRAWWPAGPGPGSLTGRRVLVTGATSGIGGATARGLAELGATVHLLGRDRAKVVDRAAALRRAVPGAEVVEEVLDVGDLDGVRRWAAAFAAGPLHGVVHNAGVMPPERSETVQGHELALAVHVLGPHLMTHLLRDRLAAGAADGGSAVVWMSSGGMYSAGLRSTPDTIEHRDGDYTGIRAYARTKRMQVVLADAWAQVLGSTGVEVASMHPGWAGTPGLSDQLPGFERVVRPLLRTAAGGADTAVWLVATRPRSRPGHFWHDRAQRPTTYGWERGQDPRAVAAFTAYVGQVTGAPLLAEVGAR